MNELIRIEQLPVITEQFQKKKLEVEDRLKPFKNVIVNEENRKEIKEIRADLNKESKEYDLVYRGILESVESPIKAFKEAYKENIQNLYIKVDAELKKSIDSIEQGLKDKRINEIKDYFDEYKASLNNQHIEFATWEKLGLKIGLSESDKKLKEEIKKWLDRINKDTLAILTMKHPEETMLEYQNWLDLSNAIQNVDFRKKAQEEIARKKIEQEKINREEKEKKSKMQEAIKPVMSSPTIKEELSKEDAEEIFCMSFKVHANIDKLKLLKEFLVENEIRFEKV